MGDPLDRRGGCIAPGDVRIEIRAPGRVAYVATKPIAEGENAVVEVDDLERTAAARPAAPPDRSTKPDVTGTAAKPPSSSVRTAGFIVGSTGVVALAVGGAFGAHALITDADADARR